MAIAGFRHTGNFVADARPQNWREKILRSYPNGKMPLTGLTSMMKSRVVDDPQYNWWEKQMETQRFVVSAAATNVATTLTLQAKALTLKIGDLLYSEHTGEIMRVTADPTIDTSVTVQRAFSDTTGTALDPAAAGVNPHLSKIGSAYEEGSTSPKGIAFDPNKRWNYTQIFRDTLEATRTAKVTRLRHDDAIVEARRECLELHGISMERAFWFGKRWEGTINGKPARTTGGIVNFIAPENIKTATPAGMDMEELEEMFYLMFLRGSDEKIAIGGNRALLTINRILRKNAQWQINGNEKEYGMNVTRVTSPFGHIVFKTHPLFNLMRGGTTGGTAYNGWESAMFVLDAAELQYVYITGGDTQYQQKLQVNDLDGEKSGYLTECGIEMHHPDHHFLIKGMVAAATDD